MIKNSFVFFKELKEHFFMETVLKWTLKTKERRQPHCNSSQVEGGGDGEDADELGKDWLPVILPAMLQHLEGS